MKPIKLLFKKRSYVTCITSKIRTALLGAIIVVVFRLEESSTCHYITATLAECFSYSNLNSPAVPSSAAVAPKNADKAC